MFCPNCGAPVKDSDMTCPYCSAIQPLAAESQYMQQLEQIKDTVKELESHPSEEYKKELRHHGIFTMKLMFLILGIIGALFLIIASVLFLQHRWELQELRKETIFATQYFPKLDAVYATGDDDAVATMLDKLYGLDGSSSLYRWKHMEYYECYSLYQDVVALDHAIANDTYTFFDVFYGLYSALSLTRDEFYTEPKNSFSEMEADKLLTFQQDSETLLLEHFHLTPAEADAVYEQCLDHGFLSFSLCKHYAETIMDQIS